MHKKLYEILNKENKETMEREINHSFKYEWDDDTLFKYLTLEYPRVNSYLEKDAKLRKIVNAIDTAIYDFSGNRITKSAFVSKLKELNDKYDATKGPDGFRSYRYHLRLIDGYETLLIRSPGGMGKSFFIYTLEQKLEEKGIKHLVLYGKTFCRFNDIDCDEIIKTANEENFVFAFDAINEIKNEDDYKKLVNIIQTIKTANNIFIIATYRDSSGFDHRVEQLGFKEVYFSGISYDDALYQIQEMIGNVPIEYDEVLRTNNPLYIQALFSSLRRNKYERKKSIESLTTLLEDYVKQTVGIKCWDLYKRIANEMYKHKRKHLYEKEIMGLVNANNQKDYISLIDRGFVVFNGSYYQFHLDLLTDYLIARSAFNDIKKAINKEQTILDLYNDYYFLEEALTLTILDGFDDKVFALNLIKNSGVHLSCVVLSKLVLPKEQIEKINNECFKSINDYYDAFYSMAGLRNKLFNCVNKLHKYFIANEEEYFKLCLDSEDDRRFLYRIKLRLKRNMFIAAKAKCMDVSGVEYLYFAIWSLGLSDSDAIVLARKTISMLVDLNDDFLKETIKLYIIIKNPFIKDGIVEALSASSHKNVFIKKQFFNKLIKDKHYVNAKNLALIERYFFRPINPCRYNKDKYLEYIDDKYLTEDYLDLLSTMYLRHDIYLCFEYYGNHFTTNLHFIKADKELISSINKRMMKQYQCFKDGDCCGSMCVGDVLKGKYRIKEDDYVSAKRMAEITGYFLHQMLSQLGYTIKDLKQYYKYSSYSSSVIIRLLKIAESEMLGVLMSNYYIDEFSTYNGYENPVIGFQAYNPLEFESDYYTLNAVVPLHNDCVERLDNAICRIISKDDRHDKKWGLDQDSIKKEICAIINKPIQIEKELYYPIAFVCKYIFDNEYTYEYLSFRIAIDLNIHLGNTNDRFAYIEFYNFRNNINDYGMSDKDNTICLEIEDFGRSLNFLSQKRILLPPAIIIKDNNLKANTVNSSFDLNGEPIIYFNQTLNKYGNDFVKSSVYLRKDIYEKYIGRIRYFGFLERSVLGYGIYRPSAVEFETDNDFNLSFIKHYVASGVKTEPNPRCLKCNKSVKKMIDKKYANAPSVNEIIKQLGYK